MEKINLINTNLHLDNQTNELHYFKYGLKHTPEKIRLDFKTAGILQLLIKNSGQLINRQDFIDTIWEGNHLVGEKGLTRNMSRLRALIKKHGLKEYIDIQTISKKGYLLRINKQEKKRQASFFNQENNTSLFSHPKIVLASGLVLFMIFILGRHSAGNPITITLSATFGN